jgi:hypothetical protein
VGTDSRIGRKYLGYGFGYDQSSDSQMLRIPIFGDRWNYIRINYNNDLIRRFESYFGAVFILEGKYGEFYKLCLPFYK